MKKKLLEKEKYKNRIDKLINKLKLGVRKNNFKLLELDDFSILIDEIKEKIFEEEDVKNRIINFVSERILELDNRYFRYLKIDEINTIVKENKCKLCCNIKRKIIDSKTLISDENIIKLVYGEIKEEIKSFYLDHSNKFYWFHGFLKYNFSIWESDIKKSYCNFLLSSNEKDKNLYPLLIPEVRNFVIKKISKKKLSEILEKELTLSYSSLHKNMELLKVPEFKNLFENYIFPKMIIPFEKNQTKIKSFIKNSNSGSFLLSGYRWVWKTSLLKKTFNEFNENAENTEKIIPIFVNIPEPSKNKHNQNKEFSKKQIMDFIIRNLYKEVKKQSSKLPKSFVNKLEDQYIRTFKEVENIEWDLVVKKRWLWKLIFWLLQYGLPFGFLIMIIFILRYF